MLDLPVEAFHFRRPFSVLSVQTDGSFDLYYKRVGKGTQMMWDLSENEQVQILGPLGNRFEVSNTAEKTLLIGGGIGIAPLYHWALQQQENKQQTGHCFYGVRGKAEIGLQNELSELFESRYYLATDDGSAGHHGNVCDLLVTQSQIVKEATTAYICGPTRMMEAVVQLLEQINPGIQMQVSLEEHMPCGTGACTGCVVQRSDQTLPSKVCVEGPIFDARNIQWQTATLAPACSENQPCLS